MRNLLAIIQFLVVAMVLFSSCGPEPESTAAPLPFEQPTTSAEEEIALPKIVPPLDCLPSERDGEGAAGLSPSTPVLAGTVNTFEITFTVGEGGIDPKGFVILQIPPWWGWTEPQTLSAETPGYTQVSTSFEDASFQAHALRLHRVIAYCPERGFKAGDRLVFRYGPARVDRYAEKEALIQVFVDGDGDGHYACIADPPTLRITPHPPAYLAVNSPSQVAPGETAKITVAALDGMGNRSRFMGGEYTVKVHGTENPPKLDPITSQGGEDLLNLTVELSEVGLYFFDVQGPGGLMGRSNVLLCREGTPSLNLYFGDIHGHTHLSDGTGTPEDYYPFAREVSGLQISAITDHGDYGTIQVKGPVWERIKRATNNAYVPGEFVTFVAFEWTNWVYGHRNVYYRDGDGPVFRSFDPESDTPQKLWQLLEPYEAMTAAHHVGGGPICADWSIPPGDKEWLVEISSVHGSSEYYGGEAAIYSPVEGAFVRDALNRGYKLGIYASGDTHDGHPGKRSAGAPINGIFGVYAPELTREAIWDAFKRRQIYGTSGPKIILFFRVADAPMGSEVAWPADKGPIPLAVQAVGCDEVERIEIIRNGELVYMQEGDGYFVQSLIEDQEPPVGENWYYARVVQEDGNMAWSSPVWVDTVDTRE